MSVVVTRRRPSSQPTPLAKARGLLAAELKEFDRILAAALASQRDHLTEVELKLYQGGKRVRPMLLLLSTRAAQPAGDREDPVAEKAIRAAASLEMLHVATLVHDDIIDGADTRRGNPTVSAARGRDVALLIGDLQFVHAIRCFADAVETDRDMDLVRSVLAVGHQLCCGQLDELAVDRSMGAEDLHRHYLQTIDRKTAVLFALSCECGAILGGSDDRDAYLFGRFGHGLGRAFQIMDDLRDLLEPGEQSGKPQAADLAQGRLSLPLIYARPQLRPDGPAGAALRGEALTPELTATAAEEVAATNAFIRAYADARSEVVRAVGALQQLPPGDHNEAMQNIAYDVVDRGFAAPSKPLAKGDR